MRSLLRRCLTCSLALYLLGGLATLSVPAHEVRAQTTSSSSTAIQITEAYVGLLGRAPDPAGLSYWVKQLDAAVAAGRDATLALKKLMNDIANSPEYKAGPQGTSVPTTGNPSEAQAAAIVQDIYSNLFDRNASQADLDYWTPQLTGGSTTAPEMTINLITAAKSNPSGADGQVLGYKEDAATYYAQNVAGERFTRGEAEQAVEGVVDELTLAKSIDSTDALADEENVTPEPTPEPSPVPVEPKYELLFSVGAGGKIVNPVTGFECEYQPQSHGEPVCEMELQDGLRTTYEVVPNEHYQFAGWTGDICNTPDTYDNPQCEVSVNSDLHIKAEFSRIAYIERVESTEEFEVSSSGFGAFYSDEISPVTCYPSLDKCAPGDYAVWHQPHNYATGDFNADGFQDLLAMPFSNAGYVRDMEVRPTIFLNDRKGGLYRSDSIFEGTLATGMQFGYRVAVADFNGDDRDDFVVGAMATISREPHNYMKFVPERYLIYLSGEDGKLYDASDLIEGQENGAVMPDMKFAHDLATGDIDDDGDVDIWMAGKLFENNGHGEFDVNITLKDIGGPFRSYLMSSLIADFDGDGIEDLVYAQADPNSEVWLYLSQGEPDLLRRQRFLMPVGRFGVENTKQNHMDASDLDGDGDLDIVIGQTRSKPYYEGRELQVLINDGYGNFTDETDARLGDQSYYSTGEAFNQGEGQVHLIDVNADGYIDIFDRRGANPQHDQDTLPPSAGASIWLNDGTGHFVDVPPTVFPVVGTYDLAPKTKKYNTARLRDATPIDIDNDGAIDVVSYVVTKNPGPGTFNESTLYLLTAKKFLDSSDYDD